MTVSDFAVQMYYLDIVKDNVVIIQDDKVVYNGRMETLRYAHEEDPKHMWFAGCEIQSVMMNATQIVRDIDYGVDYNTVIYI